MYIDNYICTIYGSVIFNDLFRVCGHNEAASTHAATERDVPLGLDLLPSKLSRPQSFRWLDIGICQHVSTIKYQQVRTVQDTK